MLDRVLTWPTQRQADVVKIVEFMEKQDKSDLTVGRASCGSAAAHGRSESRNDSGRRTLQALQTNRSMTLEPT